MSTSEGGSEIEVAKDSAEAVEYECDRCGYQTSDRSHFQRHLHNKIPCPPIKSSIDREEIIKRLATEKNQDKYIPCDLCDKVYSTRQGLYMHKKQCHQVSTLSSSSNHILQQQVSLLQQQVKILINEVTDQKKTIETYKKTILSLQIQLSEHQKNEAFYQIIVEKYLNGTHKRLESGITDVTNNDTHAEIKRWARYKEGLGQLLTYNRDDPKERLQMYFFGKSSAKLEACAISHCKDKNIEVFMFDMFPDRVNIVEYSTKNIVYTYISGTT